MAVDAEAREAPAQAGDDARGGGGRRRWSPARVAVLALAVVALGAVLFFTRGGDDPAEDAAPVPAGMDDNYETYIDPEAGFSLEHPETWIPIARPDASRRLVLGAGGKNTVSVRYNENDQAINTIEDLEKIRPTTDRIAGPEGVQVLKREALLVNGMPTLYYLSRFTDEATGAKGVNAQHFLFQGTNMYILLFQAFPEEEFDRLAPEFDKIRASFRGDPDYVAPPAAEAPEPSPPAEPAG